MHPDVDWPNGWEGGRVQGHSAVRHYWARQWAEISPRAKPLRVEPREDGSVAVHVHQFIRSRTGERLADDTVRHVYRFRDGLVERMEIEPAGTAARRAPPLPGDPGSRGADWNHKLTASIRMAVRPARPVLTAGLPEPEFRRCYWLKEELLAFCRACGLSRRGSKTGIAERIAEFLRTGTVPAAKPSGARGRGPMPDRFARDSVIGPERRCTQALRSSLCGRSGPGSASMR